MENSVLLYGPNNQPLIKAEGKANRLQGFGGPYVLGGASSRLKGAEPNPRRADWQDYWEMYQNHPVVNAAINKKVKVCTNTGFDFVPRDNRADPNDEEIITARNFFKKQTNFMYELRRVYRYLEIFGDAYMYIVPDRRRQPSRLKALAPWTMNVKANVHGQVEMYVQSDPTCLSDEVVTFRPHEIMHFKYDNPVDDLYGMSPLEAIKLDVAADLFAAQYNTKFFENGAATGVVLVVKDASEEDMKRNKEWLREEYVGSGNSHKPIILAGDVELHHAVASHEEMGFLKGRTDIRHRILSALDVPPAKVGDIDNANRSNSKEQDKSFRTESIMPTQYVVEEVINDQFMQGILGLTETIFVHSEADVRDQQEQMDLWVKGIQNGILKRNEARGKMGLKPEPGGDILTAISPTGIVPVVDIELYFRLSKPNTQGKDPIPESMHDGHEHARGPDGTLTGPEPKESKPAPAAGQTPASKGVQAATLVDLLPYFEKARDHDPTLRQLYLHITEEMGDDRPLLLEAAKCLSKASTSPDPLLRHAFIERAQAFTLAGLGDVT